MKEIIERILNDYVPAKSEAFAGHPVGSFFRSDIPQALYSSGIVDSNDYLVTGSVGQGNWAMIPWVCVFDRSITTSATKGVYIVYLLEKTGNSLYLTFNQGCTDIRRNHSKRDTIKIMREKAAEIVSRIDSRGFRTDEEINLGERLTELGELYQKGTIFYKEYKKGNVPEEVEIRDDLSKMIEIYKEYAGKLTKHPIGVFDSWEIVDEKTAIKNCDKSFFEYNGSGLPRKIRWFFDAEDLKAGEKKDIVLLYDGQEYPAHIVRTTTESNRATIDWTSELGNKFKEKNEGKTQLQFIKNGDSYSIRFVGGEKEMPEISAKEAIAKVKEYISFRGFSYPEGLIENFYLSLKSKPFVILAGTSGTGKTRLVKLFAEAIGADYFLVPVRPDWSDGSDLFGHFDLSGHFIEGPICPAFEAAVNNPDRPVLICLDEMNLARVEYYLSDFLSVIESREKQPDGSIKTVGIAQYAEGIPSNIYIVGTVNMDETTFPFSKKVLDRANTIEFNYVDLAPTFDAASPDTSPIKMKNTMLRAEYLVLVRDCFSDQQYVQDVCDELKKINEILKKANAHVGYRVRDEIVFYILNNRKAENLLLEDEAMDNEILQKILPRIQGSSVAIKDMLVDLFKYCMADRSGIDSESGHAGHDMQNLADSAKYKNSARKIGFMMTRYEEDGFTSYWL